MEKITLSGNWDLIASGPGIITIRSAVAFDYITVAAGTLPSEISGASTHGSDDILSIETVTGQVVYVRGAMGASAFIFADHPASRTQVQIPPAPSDWNWDVRPAAGHGNEIVVNRVENATPAIMNIEYTVDGGETAIELPGLVGTHGVPEQKGLDWAYQIRNISGGGQSPWSSVKTPIYGGPVLGISVAPDPLYVGGAFTITITVPAGGTLSTVAATANGTPIALTGSGNTRTGTAPAEAGPLVVTATGADADGTPLTANRTVQVREEPVVATAPGQFSASDWSVTTGLAASQVVLNVSALPLDGGSPITALQYIVDGGNTWTALSGTGTGSRTLTMPAAGTPYTFALRAVNAVGAGVASATKSATSGAEAGGLPDWSDVDAIVFIGASHELGMFGTSPVGNPSAATPSEAATTYLASLGLNLPVYCFATGGVTSAAHNTHYAAARGQFPNALIFSGFGGNDVSEVINAGQSYATMTTEQRNVIQGRLDTIANSSVGSDDHYMPYFVSFRNYNGVALAHPELGSDPFNTGIFKDWMQSNWPWSIHADGRAQFDLYRFTRTLQGYLTSNDGYIHPTGTFQGGAIGYQLWREWLLRQVHSLLTSGTTERPADYVPAIGVDDFYIDFQSDGTANPGRNTVNFSATGVFPVTDRALVGTDNVALPYTADIVLPETAVAGGTTVNSYNANTSAVTDASFSAADRWFSGNPWSFSTTATNLYMCANVTVTVTIKGLPANTDYEITAAGLRVASTTTGIVKLTSGGNEAQYESIIAAEAGEQNPLTRSARVIGRSDASGNLVAVLSNAGGQYARVNGIGFKRVV